MSFRAVATSADGVGHGRGPATKIPLLSFFTGGGFLDIAFEANGFDVKWTNEYKEEFANIYAHGVTSWRRSARASAPEAAISNRSSIADLGAEKVLTEAFPEGLPSIFGVIGGPPCTDFSVGGVHAGHSGMAGKLTGVYINMIKALDPHFFLLENVPHLETHPEHGPQFKQLLATLKPQYAFVSKPLNALDFGVPQDRTRLFVIGFKQDLLDRWLPFAATAELGLKAHFTWPQAAYPGAKEEYEWPEAIPFGSNPEKPEGVPAELCVKHAFTPDPEMLANGQDWFVPKSSKFSTREEGDCAGKSFKRLHRFRYAPTAWYGNNEVHLHPWKARRISVREALRLQSVPDAYVMPADATLSAKFKVICNGVPYLLGSQIARSLRDFIQSHITPRNGVHLNGHKSQNQIQVPQERQGVLSFAGQAADNQYARIRARS